MLKSTRWKINIIKTNSNLQRLQQFVFFFNFSRRGSQASSPANLSAHCVPLDTSTKLAATLRVVQTGLSVQAARLFALNVQNGLFAVELVDVA
jgi:hypothetical protein